MRQRDGGWAAEAKARPAIHLQYKVGAHLVRLTGKDDHWTASVDGVDLGPSFRSSADAWTAGVAEAMRLDPFAAK